MTVIQAAAVRVPTGNLIAMGFTLLVSVGLPVVLCVLIRQRHRARFSSFLIGCGTFVVSALMLEQVLHMLVLGMSGEFGKALMGNVWTYALYGGLAAGIFEETGRFIAMKYFMKRSLNRENALMYGAGHGGAEAILIIGFTYLNNLLYSFMLNSGALDAAFAGEEGALQRAALEPLATLPAGTFLMAGVERILAVALQIALSVLVFYAVSKAGSIGYYFLAVGLHALVNFVAVVVSGLTDNAWLAEGATLALVVLVCVLARRVYGKCAAKDQKKEAMA